MHLNPLYGNTMGKYKSAGSNIFPYVNHTNASTMDQILAQTVGGFSSYIRLNRPDLIVIHGDRCEALAGALVGALNNIQSPISRVAKYLEPLTTQSALDQ